jgi:hypothetical protein
MKWRQATVSLLAFFIAVYIPFATAAYAQIASSSSQMQIDYQLPYPGLLPDNPLYFLKAFRDNLTAFFLSKPLDKAQFDLLQSDKDVQASYLLVTQQAGKEAMANTMFTQGQDYFSQAIDQAVSAKKQGYSISDLSKKLDLSNKKHQQILQVVMQQTASSGLTNEHARIDTFAKEIKALHQ